MLIKATSIVRSLEKTSVKRVAACGKRAEGRTGKISKKRATTPSKRLLNQAGGAGTLRSAFRKSALRRVVIRAETKL